NQCRLLLAVLALDEIGGPAEDLDIVLAIQRDRYLAGIGERRELDLEVELGAGEDVGAVDRIDRLRVGERSGEREARRRDKQSAHVLFLQFFGWLELFAVYDGWVTAIGRRRTAPHAGK